MRRGSACPFYPQFPRMRKIPRRDQREGSENRDVNAPHKSQLIFVQQVRAQPNADAGVTGPLPGRRTAVPRCENH
jgi:hypothetical protein